MLKNAYLVYKHVQWCSIFETSIIKTHMTHLQHSSLFIGHVLLFASPTPHGLAGKLLQVLAQSGLGVVPKTALAIDFYVVYVG